jgi:acetyl-CoA carboxylase carboxyltransferase component
MGNSKKVPSSSSDPINPQPQADSTVSTNGNNDPVYGQRQDPPTEDSGPSHRVPATGDPIGQDDAVYPQSQKDENWKSRNSNDPVYGQSQDPPTANSGPSHRVPATGDPVGHDDAVYPQARARSTASGNGNNDPVYGQSQDPPTADSGPSHRVPATGDPIGQDDAVYPQPQKDENWKSRDSSDPVYGQVSDSQSPMSGPRSSQASGDAIGSDDPVYPQPQKPSSSATSRLQQITSQTAPTPTEASAANTKKSRRKQKSSSTTDELPADYSDILAHLRTMRTISNTPDPTSRGYQRQKTAGKLWARERISLLLDPDTWHEIGAASGITTWRRDATNPQAEHVEAFVPTNNPQGFGVITDPVTGMKRRIYLTADDFSIRAGHADGGNSMKTLYMEKLALRLKVPVVKMCDGSSGGGSVSTIQKAGWSYIPHNAYLFPAGMQLNEGIPNLGMILGPAIGLGAARVVCTHFSVMAGDIGSLFNAGPKVVEGATFEEDLSFQDLGGPAVHCTNGTIDNLAKDEKECFEQVKTVLGYLPDYGGMAPPVVVCTDDVNREDISLRSIVPRKKGRAYNPWAIILGVVDRGSWFEIGGLWGRTAIVGLARLGGRPVGVLSLNCEVNSGALDAGGSQKMMKMLKFCDVFNLPILQFVDVRKFHIHSSYCCLC